MVATGPGEILRLIRSEEAVTRGEVHEVTGLSRVTVAQRIDALLEAGIIREAGNGNSTGGRRATRFVFDPTRSLVLVASIDIADAVLALVDTRGMIVARHRVEVRVDDGPEPVLARVGDGFDVMLEQAGIAHDEVGSIAISVPGPVDPLAHRLNDPPIMPGWGGWPVIETVRERFDVPVYLENDADAMAYGEFSELVGKHPRPLVLVKASSFIGAGIVIGGRIYRGFDGGAGDIGHVLVGGETRCRCGRLGCLAAEASGAAIAARMSDAGTEIDSGAVGMLVEQGVQRAIAEVQHSGELIGQVLATVVGVLNPATIVVAGTLSSPQLIASIRAAIYAGSLPRATRHLDIVPARLGLDAALIGLARVAVDDLFSEESVDRRLAAEL